MIQESNTSQETVSFDLLDSIGNLTLARQTTLLRNSISAIGPLVELVYRTDWSLQTSSTRDACPETRSLLTQLLRLKGQQMAISSLSPFPVEFKTIPRTKPEFIEVGWSTFCTRAQKAGERAGFERRLAQALAGSLDEMASNALEHSGNVNSCIAGYRWRQGSFEYVVSDSGVGVLSSLRTNAGYRWISDSGQALDVAVRDGESRHGRGTGRGMGFHDLVINIARRGSSLRFRTGEHALIIDGTGATIREELRQTGNFNGFLVSVAI